MILIDTNVVAELCRRRPAPAVERWAAGTTTPFGVSVVTIEEIRFGLACKPNLRIEAWLDRFFHDGCEIFPVTESVARRAGTLRGQLRALGKPRTQADMFIAATAQVHQLAVATRNVRDFRDCGLRLVNPFDAP